jgi:RND family efflux transporter MFP subunit
MKPALLVLVFLTTAGCGTDPDPAPAGAAPVAVTTAPVRVEPVGGVFDAGGTVRARATAVLSSRVLSTIVDVTARPGDRVRQGQVLVRLDGRQLEAGRARADSSLGAAVEAHAAAEAEIAAAASALALARATHTRILTLAERTAATPAEVDAAVAGLREAESRTNGATARRSEAERAIEAARAAARSAAVDASFAVIVAPFDAVVVEKAGEPGTLAVPGAPLVTIEDVTRFRLEVSIDAADAAGIAVGARVPTTVDGLPPVEGQVDEVVPSVDAVAHAYTIKIALPSSPGLRSGLFGRARFAGGKQAQIVIPASALVRRGQLTLVFVDDNGTARLRYVHTGAAADGVVPVLAGLGERDRIVIDPPITLADGDRLRQNAGGQAGAGGEAR